MHVNISVDHQTNSRRVILRHYDRSVCLIPHFARNQGIVSGGKFLTLEAHYTAVNRVADHNAKPVVPERVPTNNIHATVATPQRDERDVRTVERCRAGREERRP